MEKKVCHSIKSNFKVHVLLNNDPVPFPLQSKTADSVKVCFLMLSHVLQPKKQNKVQSRAIFLHLAAYLYIKNVLIQKNFK